MIVAIEPGLRGLPPVVDFCPTFEVDRVVQVHPHAFDALHAKAERIGSRQRGVVRQQHCFPVRAGDLRLHDVTESEPDLVVGMIGRLRADVVAQAARLAGIAREALEPIAAIDVRVHRAGTDAVTRVEVSIAPDRMRGAPPRFRPAPVAELDAAAVRLPGRSRVEFHSAQVVLISTLQMHQLAEHALPDHVEYRQHVAPVADVFQQHVGRARHLLRGQHAPVIIERHARHDFAADGDVLVHRFDRLLCMPLPRRHDEYRIDARGGVHLAPGVVITGVDARPGLSDPCELPEGALDGECVGVADGGHCDVIASQQLLQVHESAHADTENADLQFGRRCPMLRAHGHRQRRRNAGGQEEFASVHLEAPIGRAACGCGTRRLAGRHPSEGRGRCPGRHL